MGSGSSKQKSPPQQHVRANNNLDLRKRLAAESEQFPRPPHTDSSYFNTKSEKIAEDVSSKNNKTPSSSSARTTGRENSSKRAVTGSKISENKWDSDSDFENDLDNFIKETVSAASTDPKPQPLEEPVQRPRTSHGRANRTTPSDSVNYPETYAQKHTREHYTVDRDMLIRQKTIYRNPADWNNEDEDEEDDHGFDASKFRQVNTLKLDNQPVHSPPPEEFETPRYIKEADRKQSTYGIYDKERINTQHIHNTRLNSLPTYDLDEQRLLADLENEI